MPAVTRAENPEEELSTGETRISLRVKVPAEDGTAVMEMTGPAAPENGLQSFGDWVLAALEQHADGAAEAARLMIAALWERDWEGDDVLADQLDALLGSSAMSDLRPLRVDLDELADKHGLTTLFWGISAGPSNPRSAPRRSVRSAAR